MQISRSYIMRESDNRIQDKQLMLVIESHEPLCDKIRSSLSEKYEVKFLSQADEAIDFVRVNADYISLVLLDIQTIGTGGTALPAGRKKSSVCKSERLTLSRLPARSATLYCRVSGVQSRKSKSTRRSPTSARTTLRAYSIRKPFSDTP